MSFRTISELLKGQAAAVPDAVAIEGIGRPQLTYRAIHDQVQGVAGALRLAGIDAGDRVALAMPTSADMSIALLATTIAGTSAPLNPMYRRKEYEAYYAAMHLSHVVVQDGCCEAAVEAAQQAALPLHVIGRIGDRVCVPGNDGGAVSLSVAVDDPERVAAVMLTSGSTSQPKRVPLTHANLCASTKDVCRSLDLGPTDRCLSMWEQFHIGGLTDLLLAPLASGGTVISAGPFDVDRFFDLLHSTRPTWYQAVPTALHAIVRRAKQRGCTSISSSLRLIRSVAAALPVALKAEVEELFGVPVVQTFGMTEAAPLITSTRLPPAVTRSGSVGPSAGPDVAIMGAPGVLLESGERGEVVVRGPNVMAGYEDAPELNRELFVGGWFRTGDVGHIDEDGELFLVGRVKELINRGGEKISPHEVEEVLQSHPMVEACAVFGLPHRSLGEEVAVAVVGGGRTPLTDAELRAYAAARLVAFKVPDRVFRVEALPRTPTGKVQRLKLVEQFTPAAGGQLACKPPRTTLEGELLKIWQDVLQVPQAGITDSFLDMGGDSLAGVALLGAVQKELGHNLPARGLRGLTTVAEMAAALEDGDATADHLACFVGNGLMEEEAQVLMIVLGAGRVPSLPDAPFLKVLNPDGTKLPLVWCSNAPEKEMLALASALPDDQPLYGLYSGSGRLEYTRRVTAALAETYAPVLERIFTDGAFYVGGNCRGADVAIGVVGCLESHGCMPRGLCLVDFVNEGAFPLQTPIQILLGRQSREVVARRFGWGLPGWARKFRRRPWVDWTTGGHGQFFVSPHVDDLWARISRFLRGEPPETNLPARLSRFGWLLIRLVLGLARI
jgi:acyl-CoA synthetase (AMP-forming)/AMP-acid ligase II/acyl carrier protein